MARRFRVVRFFPSEWDDNEAYAVEYTDDNGAHWERLSVRSKFECAEREVRALLGQRARARHKKISRYFDSFSFVKRCAKNFRAWLRIVKQGGKK